MMLRMTKFVRLFTTVMGSIKSKPLLCRPIYHHNQRMSMGLGFIGHVSRCEESHDQTDILKCLKDKYKQYIIDPSYVYKISGTHLIILKRCPDTVTNESRRNVFDPKRAKFRGSKFDVIEIIDLGDMTTKQSVQSSYKHSFKYTAGEIVEPDKFNNDMDIVCTNGIHFFIDIETAFFHMDTDDFSRLVRTGKRMGWHDCGQLSYVSEWLDGKHHGRSLLYCPDGTYFEERVYINGRMRSCCNHQGKWIHWVYADEQTLEKEN
jgi:hypothetical protein